MATRNIVPRATGEGNLGTTLLHWLTGWFDSISISGNITNGTKSATVAQLITSNNSGEINAIANKATPIDADIILIEDSASSFVKKNSTWTNIKAFLKTYFDTLYQRYLVLSNLTGAVATSGTGDTLLFKLAIPANFVAIGDTFECMLFGNSSSTGTLLFKVHAGAAGTVSDATAWTGTTSAAQVANAYAGLKLLVTVRSATTIIVSGCGWAGAVVLPQLIGAPTTSAIVSTAIWYITLSCACSSGTFTAQVATINLMKI